jgi:hypothetical protein
MTNNVRHLLHVLTGHSSTFFGGMFIEDLCPFYNCVAYLLLFSFKSSTLFRDVIFLCFLIVVLFLGVGRGIKGHNAC